MMIKFDLDKFLEENRSSISDLTPIVGLTYMAIRKIKNRGTVKPRFIKSLESHFGDCSKYIVDKKTVNKKKVA